MDAQKKAKCDWCGQEVDEDSTYCKFCGQLLRPLTEYRYKDMYDLNDQWKSNIDLFQEVMNSDDDIKGIKDVIGKKYPKLEERQKKLTQLALNNFPQIRDLVRREKTIVFQMRLVRIPYWREDGDFQHECIQQTIAQMQDGLINLAVGSQKISPEICMIDFPVWAPTGMGEALLSSQYELLEKSFPIGQRDSLVSATPIRVCSRVYGYEGRWISWRLIFRTNRIDKWSKEHRQVPLNFPFFTTLEFSRFFPIAGTRDKGEVMLAILLESEVDKFNSIIENLKDKYSFKCTPLEQKVEISWKTLVDLDLIGGYEGPEEKHMFQTRLMENVMVNSTRNLGSFAEDANVGPSSESKDRFILDAARSLVDEYVQPIWYEKIFSVIQPIPEPLQTKYEIKFESHGESR